MNFSVAQFYFVPCLLGLLLASSTARADAEPLPRESVSEDPAQSHPLHLGAAGITGLTSDPLPLPFFDWDVRLTLTVHEHLTIGLSAITSGGSWATDGAGYFYVGGSPMIEWYVFVSPRIQLYGQLGLALQSRSGGWPRADGFQMAPWSVLGVRFWLKPWLTLGLGTGAHVVVTDGFLMGFRNHRRGSTPAHFSLAFEFHFDP